VRHAIVNSERGDKDAAAENHVRAGINFVHAFNTIGAVQPWPEKYSAFSFPEIMAMLRASRLEQRGVARVSSRHVRRDAMDVWGA